MATIGTNMLHGKARLTWNEVLEKMGFWKGLGRNSTKSAAADTATTRRPLLLRKNGAPATNTVADAPSGYGDLCWDYANSDLYRCTAYSAADTFTWTKIVD